MYIELRGSRFRNTDLPSLHGRIVDALNARNAEGAREAVVSDITEAQWVTLKLGKEWPSLLLPVPVTTDTATLPRPSLPQAYKRDPTLWEVRTAFYVPL